MIKTLMEALRVATIRNGHITDFQDVFINIGKQGMEAYEAYSELDINAGFDVVAFRNASNDLWAFDSFEE